jgi:hypothetical protein
VESHEGRLTLANRKDAAGCVATIALPRARLRAPPNELSEAHVEVRVGNDLRREER